MSDRHLDRDFRRFRRTGDVQSLARVFDALAGEFLGIAWRITSDAQEAEDVVQATFLTAMEKAASFDEERRVAPWLFGILLNHARSTRRRRGHRSLGEEREPIHESDGARAATATEAQRVVDDAIERLPETYRSILRGHLGGMRPREMAASLAISANSARVRLFRGLELLRRALPAGLAGATVVALSPDVRAASVARIRPAIVARADSLAPTLAASAPGQPLGLWSGALRWAAALFAGALLVGAAWLRGAATTEPAPPVLRAGASEQASEGEPHVAAGRAATPLGAVTGGGEATRSIAQPQAPGVSGAPGEEVVVRGRLVYASGEPASGTTVKLTGYAAGIERVTVQGEPDDWSDLEVWADRDGRFAFAFVPPRAYQFLVSAKRPKLVGVEWRWGSLEPGIEVDLTEAVLEPGGSILATVVDEEGNPMPSGWSVSVRTAPEFDGGAHFRSVAALPTATAGGWRFDDVAAGVNEVRAVHDVGGQLAGLDVSVVVGEEQTATLVYTGPPLDSRVTLATSTSRGLAVLPDASSVEAVGPDGEPRAATPTATGFVFDDLDREGLYHLSIEDERFLPWSRSGVVPGRWIQVELVGSSELTLHVSDSESGQPVDAFRARLRRKDVSFRPDQFLLEGGNGDVQRGVVPGSYSLVVSADGYPPASAEVGDLEPGERRAVRVALGSEAAIAGSLSLPGAVGGTELRVTLRSSQPLSGGGDGDPSVSVSGYSTAASGRPQALGRPQEERSVLVDAGERFSFPSLSAGTYELEGRASTLLSATQDVQVKEGVTTEVALALDTPCYLEGRLAVAGDVDWSSVSLELALPASEQDPEAGMRLHFAKLAGTQPPAGSPLSVQLSANGEFRLGPAAAGTYVLSLVLPDQHTRSGSMTRVKPGARKQLAEVVLEAGSTELEPDAERLRPGELSVRLTRAGEPLPGVSILASGIGVDAAGTAASDGTVTLGPLFPGRYQLEVQDRDGQWLGLAPGVQGLEPGEVRDVVVEAELVSGVVEIVDESSGAPLAGQTFLLGLVPNLGGLRTIRMRRVHTDGAGRCSLELMSGTYLFASSFEELREGLASGGFEGEVRWEAGGPTPARIRLARPAPARGGMRSSGRGGKTTRIEIGR